MPPDKTRSGTGIPPSICRTRPPRACRRRRPRSATSPAALAALSCLLYLTHLTPSTSHPTTHHLQEKKPPHNQNTHPPPITIRFSASHASPKTLMRTDPAARYQPNVLHDPYAPNTSLCGAADQHSTSSRGVPWNLVDNKGLPSPWVTTPPTRKRAWQRENVILKSAASRPTN